MTSNSSSTPKTRSEPQIQKLKDEVIDQIAAGEVVERPSHMVKELCENSLDAGATELTVDISRGGRNVIVKDNGRGLNPSELPLALARHATSKITEANDLWQIGSYGFRGEALASIGAVSRIKIISRTHEAQEGAQIECEFGRIGTVTAVGAEPGTTVQVDELYENVPARLKFLKSEAGEVTAIKLQLKALALANPQVDIRVLQDGELTFYWPATNTKHKRVEQILELQDLYNGEGEAEGVRAHVVVASPNQTAKNSRQIWLFVRGRYVQDRSLQTAVLEAYRNLLMHGEYPYAAVYIDCDPQNVDVNVSPTKSQVKFKDAGQVFRAVHRAVRGVLEKAPWVEPMLASRVGPAPTQFKNQQQPSETLSFSAPEMEQTFFQHKRTVSEFSLEKVKDALNSLEASTSETASKTAAPNTATLVTTTRALWSQLEVLGQSHLTYIITQNSDAILFIDQHAAHERVLFERLLKNYKDGQIDVQNFLLPVTADFDEETVSEILLLKNEFEKMGVSIDQSGPSQIAITAAPSIVKPESLQPMLIKLVDDVLDRGESLEVEKVVAELFATFACHSAIRAGQSLSIDEMQALLNQMDEFSFSSFCPHGRPVFVEYPIKKLERDFGRIT